MARQRLDDTQTAAVDRAAVIQAIVTFAKAQGYDFSPEELKTYQNEMHAIPDEQLDAATGGRLYAFPEGFEPMWR